MSPGRPTRWRTRVAIATGYFALAVALTWPLATSLASHLPMGTEKVASVPMLNAWTVWWNADQARYGFSRYWHAPIFYPSRYALAFSEAQPTTLAVAPIVTLAGAAAAYNAYLLGMLTLNGLVGYRLLRRVGLAVVPAVLGGVIVVTLPIVHWQLGVLQLTTLCGVLWVLDRLIALRDGNGERGSGRSGDGETNFASATRRDDVPSPSLSRSPAPVRIADSLLLGLAAAVCYAACNYFGLFLSVLLPLAVAPLVWGRWRDVRFWLLLAASCLIAAGLSSPILWAQFVAKQDYEWEREESLLVSLSADPRDYVNPPRQPLIELFDLKDPNRPFWFLGTGPVVLLLGAGGVVAGLVTRGRRRWTLFLVVLAAAAFGLSLGPPAETRAWWFGRGAFDWSPYKALMAIHPGLALARSPFRFAFFVQLAIALLAAGLLDGLWVGIRKLTASWKPLPRKIGVGLVSTAVLAIGIVAAIEVWPAKQRLVAVPSLDQAWIEWLNTNSDPSRPIVCVPFPMGATVSDYERTSRFMYEQIGHRRPMVGGYSGFFPPQFLSLKDLMSEFPGERVLTELRAREVSHVISADAAWTKLADRSPSLRLAFRDEDAKVSVYRVLPPGDPTYERFFGP